MAEVAVLPGDGIGREVIPAAIRVLDAIDVAYEFTEVEAGDRVKAETGEALPAETRAVVARADATLFGAAGDTAADVILPLRSVVDSFVNIRPARTYPGVDALQPDTDLVILRENTEGVYAGIENRLSDDVSTLTRVITKRASRRLAEYACDYVTDHGYDGFTIAHKANVMRITDGVFVETVEAVATERGVRTDTAIMDALAMLVVMEPAEYDVIVTPNLAGDVISDVAAGLVGGLGLLPSANVGPERAVFEPVHGSAPDIAGDGIANPAAAILSAAMLCEFLGDNAAGERIRDAVTRVLQTGPHTPDLGGNATTDDVTTAIIDHL